MSPIPPSASTVGNCEGSTNKKRKASSLAAAPTETKKVFSSSVVTGTSNNTGGATNNGKTTNNKSRRMNNSNSNKRSSNGISTSQSASAAAAAAAAEAEASWKTTVGFQEMTLEDIRDRIVQLCLNVPALPESILLVPEADGEGEATTSGETCLDNTSSSKSNNNEGVDCSGSTGASASAAAAAAVAVLGEDSADGTDAAASAAAVATKHNSASASKRSLLRDAGVPPQSRENHHHQQKPRKQPPPLCMPKPRHVSPYDKVALRTWAAKLQAVLEEFHLLTTLVSPATYCWANDRSGAAEQHLQILSQELVRSQEQIAARVTPRLTDVLAPVNSLVTDRTVTTKKKKRKTKTTTTGTGPSENEKKQADDDDDYDDDDDCVGDEDLEVEEEEKQNYFVNVPEDPDYVEMCFDALARNAVLLRQVVLANFDKLLRVLRDYLKALTADSQQDAASRAFAY